LKRVKNAKVAVFASGIDTAKTETKDTIAFDNANQLLNYNKTEEKWIENVIY
jgi:T-complex protein 1 subunit theta